MVGLVIDRDFGKDSHRGAPARALLIVNASDSTTSNQAMGIVSGIASGISLRRLIAPVLALAFILTLISGYLLGFLEPYTRFSYRYLVHLVTETQWNSAIERGAFFTGFGGKTILINDISDGGHTLSKIYVKEEDGDKLVLFVIH